MKTRTLILIVGIILTSIIFGTYQSILYQCGTMPVFMETPRSPTLWKCLDIWKHQSNQQSLPSEPELASAFESMQQQMNQQEKLRVQEIVLADTRGTENKINAIKEYRDKFETGYFLEQFIHPTKQNFEKDRLMHFISGEWGFQPTEHTSPKVTVYFRSYENYDNIEKINE
ncbi:hypothetical protein [Nitrosopumilus sp.]|uniref:hypothetical protein n=1 Tax=Nitrosopumilus sp. TaxID=2024843 RepID=UPI00349FD53A